MVNMNMIRSLQKTTAKAATRASSRRNHNLVGYSYLPALAPLSCSLRLPEAAHCQRRCFFSSQSIASATTASSSSKLDQTIERLLKDGKRQSALEKLEALVSSKAEDPSTGTSSSIHKTTFAKFFRILRIEGISIFTFLDKVLGAANSSVSAIAHRGARTTVSCRDSTSTPYAARRGGE